MTRTPPNENTLIRSVPCETCGARMLWTQGAWVESAGRSGDELARAAYQCSNGHLLDPALTPQCPECGIHDTGGTGSPSTFACHRCHATFSVPRSA